MQIVPVRFLEACQLEIEAGRLLDSVIVLALVSRIGHKRIHRCNGSANQLREARGCGLGRQCE